jgi:hypothetical protein
VRNECTTKSNGAQYYPKTSLKKVKANWIGHILHRNCILNHDIKEKKKGK